MTEEKTASEEPSLFQSLPKALKPKSLKACRRIPVCGKHFADGPHLVSNAMFPSYLAGDLRFSCHPPSVARSAMRTKGLWAQRAATVAAEA